MAGAIVLSRKLRVSAAVEELLLIAECSEPGEWVGVVASAHQSAQLER
jgi:hypothetical protein